MNKKSHSLLFSTLAAAGTWTMLSTSVVAAPDICAAQAVGVPSRPGAPKWFAWNAGDVVDTTIDDPRWNLASGKNFSFGASTSGGAKVPLQTRALWANEGGQDFLYLSFVVNITPAATGSTTSARDIYLGFRPSAPFDPHVLDGGAPTGSEYGYIFQFHLDSTTTGGGPTSPITPIRCDDDTTCGELGSAPTNFWRVFVDYNDSGATGIGCADAAGTTVKGQQFRMLPPDPLHPLVGPPAWVDNAVRMWKLDATPSFPLLKNQWAVQIRIPLVEAATPNANIRMGVVKGSNIWYELTADIGPNRSSISSWPLAADLGGTHVCQRRSAGNVTLVHPAFLNTGATKWSLLSQFNYGASPPSDCTGLSLEQSDIGVVYNPPGGTDFGSATLTTELQGGGLPNELVARVSNTSGTALNVPLIARFRLANWGAAPFWQTGDKGLFTDIRGAENGVCAAGSAPGCTSVSVPAGGATKVPMHFQWTIGSGAGVDTSEYCKYQVGPLPTGVSCVACNCATDSNRACDSTSDPGVRATTAAAPTANKCVSARGEHQCVMVEVDAPNADATFVNRSNWNNLEFRHTSEMEQIATIDTRGLPKKNKGQKTQDIYLVVMPRNMPETTAPTTSVDLIRQRVDQVAINLSRSYLEDIQNMGQQNFVALRQKLGRPVAGQHVRDFVDPCGNGNGNGSGSGQGSGGGSDCNQRDPNDAELALEQAMQIMPDDDYAKAQKLLDIALTPDGPGQAEMLTHKAVDTLGPNDAADLVPTLDVYAFYRSDMTPVGKPGIYVPMTSFSVFLFHDATPIHGMRWAIDGFLPVGKNIYRSIVLADSVKVINIRAQSLEDGEDPIASGDPDWPEHGCGAAGTGGSALVALGLAFAIRRRKRAQA